MIGSLCLLLDKRSTVSQVTHSQRPVTFKSYVMMQDENNKPHHMYCHFIKACWIQVQQHFEKQVGGLCAAAWHQTTSLKNHWITSIHPPQLCLAHWCRSKPTNGLSVPTFPPSSQHLSSGSIHHPLVLPNLLNV